ncbi:MAG: hypothetical protein Q9M91_08645 [Candidatus Dojkabacteria bacterium]|nr:hypothetical protein [Candidatus Dojkabacteria bacterium]
MSVQMVAKKLGIIESSLYKFISRKVEGEDDMFIRAREISIRSTKSRLAKRTLDDLARVSVLDEHPVLIDELVNITQMRGLSEATVAEILNLIAQNMSLGVEIATHQLRYSGLIQDYSIRRKFRRAEVIGWVQEPENDYSNASEAGGIIAQQIRQQMEVEMASMLKRIPEEIRNEVVEIIEKYKDLDISKRNCQKIILLMNKES